MRRSSVGVLLGALVAATGCEQVEVVVDSYRDLTPHEAYVEGLRASGLAETALTRDWLAAADAALETPLSVSVPFIEEGYFTPDDAMAVGYRFALARGRTATITLSVDGETTGRVFFDLLRVAENPEDPPRPVRADTVDLGFVYEPPRDGEYLVRVQPELLRGGAYRLEVRLDAALAFPVEGADMTDAWSQWGDPRDGGRRTHEGVDIFAPRGTPVLAAFPGRVRRVGTSNLGGNVVWVRDPGHNRDFYYAHLDSQYVEEGAYVEVGDTVGFVGNTGNARTTPPHLHFGVYYRGAGGSRRGGEGAVNPVLFIRPERSRPAELDVDRDAWGTWVRVAEAGIRLRTAPSLRADVVEELERFAPVRVMGGSDDFYRVELPDGRAGYLAARLTEPMDDAIGTVTVAVESLVVAAPGDGAPRMDRLAAGAESPVLGRWRGWTAVPTASGRWGWIPAAVEVATDDG